MDTQATGNVRRYYPRQSAIAFAVALGALMLFWLYVSYVHEQAIYRQDLLFGLPRAAAISLIPAVLAFWRKLPLWFLVVGSVVVAFLVGFGYVKAVT